MQVNLSIQETREAPAFISMQAYKHILHTFALLMLSNTALDHVKPCRSDTVSKMHDPGLRNYNPYI